MTGVAPSHDRFFRRLFSQRETAIGFLRSYLPEDVAACLALESLEIAPGSFVDPELRLHFADVVYRVPLAGAGGTEGGATAQRSEGGGEALVYVLLEHKSAPDRLVPLQLLRYLTQLWDDHLRQAGGRLPLPPVIPLVLHHGRRRWSVPTEFSALVGSPEALAPFVPRFRYLLVDRARLGDEELRGPEVVRAALLAMLHVFDPDPAAQVERVLRALVTVIQTATGRQVAVAILHYYHTRASQADLQKAVEQAIPGPEGERLMKTAWDEATEQGAIATAREDVVEVLEVRFGRVPHALRERVHHIEDLVWLRALLRTAAVAESLDAFGRALEGQPDPK